ncbi:hypothetical protein Fmac_014676 [Flemingia macrophylla]|uniref:Uncharacterized protein n=1 Tax=Flemingia macrophylla TaxID=520843 RepID=A0ABD1MCE7_9FABA
MNKSSDEAIFRRSKSSDEIKSIMQSQRTKNDLWTNQNCLDETIPGRYKNWHVCQAAVAVETVLRDSTLNPMLELLGLDAPTTDDAFEGEVTCIDKWMP